jgi:toxin ParE1/3/4
MTVTWSRRAIRNLTAICDYIAEDSERNAELVAARIVKAVELLRNHPEIGRAGRVLGTRELVVQDTSCVIPYRIRHRKLQLIAVLHGRQKWPLEF